MDSDWTTTWFAHDLSLRFPKLKQHNSSLGRVYLVEDGPEKGEVFPSITRVLAAKPKPGLEAWKKRVGPKEAARVSQRATIRGANVHKLAEHFLKNETPPEHSTSVQELWQHLGPWLAENITKVYTQEQDVYSRRLKVAGRLDLLADVRGRRAVVDIKTAGSEKLQEWVEDYFLQAAFYSLAVYELTGTPIKLIVLPIVHPGGVQLFEASPADYWHELKERIDEFYEVYQNGLLTEQTA